MLEWLLEYHGQRYSVHGRDIGRWEMRVKHGLSLAAARQSTAPYIMGLDAFDVVYTGNLWRAVELMRSKGKQMLLCGDEKWWPEYSPEWLKEKEEQGDGWRRYLNAGAWIAKREYAIEFLDPGCRHWQIG